MSPIVLMPEKSVRHLDDEEHRIQCACVAWFRLQYPHLSRLLYAIPNGGSRNRAVAGKMKMEGVTAGAPDLKLDVARCGFSTMDIEMKTPKGVQSQRQKDWQKDAEANGHLYVVCHSLEEFMGKVNGYLRNEPQD